MLFPKGYHYGRVIIWKNLLWDLEHLMKMYDFLFSVQWGHLWVMSQKGMVLCHLPYCSEWENITPTHACQWGRTPHVIEPSSVFNQKLSFSNGSCLRVHRHGSAGWTMTSNISLSPLLPNHLGPFPDNKTMSLHICLDIVFSKNHCPLRRNAHPHLRVK